MQPKGLQNGGDTLHRGGLELSAERSLADAIEELLSVDHRSPNKTRLGGG